jgi:uncharacterized SAM-dependent methyltransferase
MVAALTNPFVTVTIHAMAGKYRDLLAITRTIGVTRRVFFSTGTSVTKAV